MDRLLLERDSTAPNWHPVRFRFLDKAEAGVDPPIPDLLEEVSRKRVRRLMRLLGVHAIFQRPRTSQAHPGHRVYPYLLRSDRY